MKVLCPVCFCDTVEPVESYTVIDGSSMYKQSTRYDENGPLEVATKPIYRGNKTTYHCRHCGNNFVIETRSDEVDVIKER